MKPTICCKCRFVKSFDLKRVWESFCGCPSVQINPISGEPSMYHPNCSEINTWAACPWYEAKEGENDE